MSTTEKTPETSSRQMSFTVLDSGEIEASFVGLDPLRLDPNAIPASLRESLICAGAISRLRSYASRLEGDERTPAALRDSIAAGISDLLKGIFTRERASGGVTEFSTEIRAANLYRRLGHIAKGNPAETFTETPAETAVLWESLSPEQRKTVQNTTRYQQALAQIKAENALRRAEKLAKKADSENDTEF